MRGNCVEDDGFQHVELTETRGYKLTNQETAYNTYSLAIRFRTALHRMYIYSCPPPGHLEINSASYIKNTTAIFASYCVVSRELCLFLLFVGVLLVMLIRLASAYKPAR